MMFSPYLIFKSCHLFLILLVIIYEEAVRLFYANLFENDTDDLESMVLGTCIILDAYQFEKIFSAKFQGFDVFVGSS